MPFSVLKDEEMSYFISDIHNSRSTLETRTETYNEHSMKLKAKRQASFTIIQVGPNDCCLARHPMALPPVIYPQHPSDTSPYCPPYTVGGQGPAAASDERWASQG